MGNIVGVAEIPIFFLMLDIPEFFFFLGGGGGGER